ncbi:MAG: tRNA (adenosine(37)-N6)-threonylcarbamoyltransferase complex ATPase subunit type 1 TsaE [Clostridiales bacterium]|nr:tRNA (adenosine(37)-N6)-threonylcarbamoyltransferase complex ATPase subunit type 1 TsaE [Clostridiales bacterium]
MSKTYFVENEAKTEELGSSIAPLLRKGDIIFLRGDLGAGKTTFVRGVASYFGCEDMVTSPTFALMNIYDNEKLSIYHFDLYRLGSADDILDAGFDELMLDNKAVSFIEWPDEAQELLTDCPLTFINISYEGDGRLIEINGELEERL